MSDDDTNRPDAHRSDAHTVDAAARSASKPPRSRRSKLLPWALILFGVLLLIDQVGIFHWGNLLGLLELWPLALIAIGVDLISRGRYRGWIAAGTVAVGLAAVQLFGLAPAVGPLVERTVSFDRDGAQSASVHLMHSVGRLELTALPAGDPQLLAGVIRVGTAETIERSLRLDDGHARIELGSKGWRTSGTIRGDRRRWDLSLSRDLPVDLHLEGGVGEARLDLRQIDVERLRIGAGVGAIRVDLPETGGYIGDIQAGVGEVIVRIPASVPAQVRIQTGIGNVAVRGAWEQDGDLRRTPGFAAAPPTERIELNVQGGIGRIRVERID